ncbi:hypothetical protein SAMN03159382_00539 [Pseudomonas sp. NFACC23-1]|nr:hypothetical protein SAMN03159386_03835 [Pseudomonas sp. NFACC17-2]SEI92501.1 hypothetical protein SAMN03159382_00539 [Pseudomonas sp. NFACC23-1]SFW85081.1 hypothetical protein SAMN05660640_04333 [Pseudomonas sp. NFACC16-2]
MRIKKMILTFLALAVLAFPFWVASQEPRQNVSYLASCQEINVPCFLPVGFKGWPQ